MEESLRSDILRGNWEELPDDRPSVVRIFMSSTFADFKAERDILLDKAYPELREFCQSMGLDFQVVDMRWGVRDESSSDHRITELCLQEIRNCQRLSLGPNFVLFLGDRYGHQPLPRLINATEMDAMRIALIFNNVSVSLFERWYVCDNNATPPVFVLQPITTHYPHYNDETPENAALRERAKAAWGKAEVALQSQLHRAAMLAMHENFVDDNYFGLYGKSVTEQEVIEGVFNLSRPQHHVLCFIRNLHDMDTSGTLAHSYTDVKDGQVDENAQRQIRALKDMFENGMLDVDPFVRDIKWDEKGVSSEIDEHSAYLEEVRQLFISNIKCLVVQAMASEGSTIGQDWLAQEVLHHATFCKKRAETFRGRDDMLQAIDGYLLAEGHNRPFIIHGPSGRGKTSLVAKVVYDLQARLGDDSIVVVRFLGTSPRSSTIHDVLSSVCLQLCEVAHLEPPGGDVLDNFSNVASFFAATLTRLADARRRRVVVVVLDALDQLSSAEGAYSLNWLPLVLPPGVRLVVSTMPDVHGILPRMRKLLSDARQYLEVTEITQETAEMILEAWLINRSRTLTARQRALVQQAFRQCQQPLFLRLVVDEACQWMSFTPTDEIHLATSVTAAIRVLYKRLEIQHGKVLVHHAMAYLLAAKSGLTEQELDNLLSSDDEVLDDVYQYWSPPVKHLIRIPPILWTRLRHDIRDYLVERTADGKTVIALYHRQFIETATDMYLSDAATRRKIHVSIAHLFLGTWSEGRKKKLHLSQRGETYLADRNIDPQPLRFGEERYNYRKLRELPYHLIEAGMIDELAHHCFGCYEWLDVKWRATSVQEIINDFNQLLERRGENAEIRLLRDAFRLLKPTVEFPGSTATLGEELIGRLTVLRENYPQFIGKLVEECHHSLEMAPHALLIPRNACFQSPGGSLRATLVGHLGGITDLVLSDGGSIMVTSSDDGTAKIWDLSTDAATYTLSHPDAVKCVAMTSDEEILVTYCADDVMRVWGVENGRLRTSVAVGNAKERRIPMQPILLIAGDQRRAAYAADRRLYMLDLERDDVIARQCVLETPISAMCILATSRRLVTGHTDGAVKVLDSTKLAVLHDVRHHKQMITCLLLIQPTMVAAGSKDGSISVVDTARGQVTAAIGEFSGEVNCMAVNNDRSMVSVGSGCDLNICDITSDEILLSFTAHADVVNKVAFVDSDDDDGDGQKQQLLVSASRDESLRTWRLLDVRGGGNSKLGQEMSARLTGMAVDVDRLLARDDLIVSASTRLPYVKLWDAQPDLHVGTPMYVDDGTASPAWTRDGRLVATQHRNRADVVVFDMTDVSGQSSGTTMDGHRGGVTSLAVTADGHLASGGVDGRVKVRNLETGAIVDFPVQGEVVFLDAHPSKPLVAACLREGAVVVLINRDDASVVAMGNGSTVADRETFTAFHLADEYVVIGTSGGRMIVRKCSPEAPLVFADVVTSGVVQHVTSSRDGRHFAAAGDRASAGDSTSVIAVWQVEAGSFTCVGKLNTSPYAITCLGMTDDGAYVIAGTRTRQVVVWRCDTAEKIIVTYVYSSVTALKVNDDIVTVGTRMGFLGRYKIHQARVASEQTIAGKEEDDTHSNNNNNSSDNNDATTALSSDDIEKPNFRSQSRSISCVML